MNDSICVYDMDGTLADVEHRLRFIEQGNWSAYFAGADRDKLIEPVYKSLLENKEKGYKIFLLTARHEANRKVTVKWLRANRIPYFVLLMRGDNDKREPTVFKKHIYGRILKGYKIESVY